MVGLFKEEIGKGRGERVGESGSRIIKKVNV
jgi:hypothetical protein